jgi:hypothetical protein
MFGQSSLLPVMAEVFTERLLRKKFCVDVVQSNTAAFCGELPACSESSGFEGSVWGTLLEADFGMTFIYCGE